MIYFLSSLLISEAKSCKHIKHFLLFHFLFPIFSNIICLYAWLLLAFVYSFSSILQLHLCLSLLISPSSSFHSFSISLHLRMRTQLCYSIFSVFFSIVVEVQVTYHTIFFNGPISIFSALIFFINSIFILVLLSSPFLSSSYSFYRLYFFPYSRFFQFRFHSMYVLLCTHFLI